MRFIIEIKAREVLEAILLEAVGLCSFVAAVLQQHTVERVEFVDHRSRISISKQAGHAQSDSL